MFKKTCLDNGMVVLMERMSNLRSVSLGIWVKAGSRHEPRDRNGISHFLEHMFFKGTRSRSASDIAVEIDSLGGEMNAFTSKEGTTFYIKVLDDYLGKGAELLLDVFMNSNFPDEEVKRERDVVKEEIKMVEDTPDEYIHDLFSRLVWGESGLGRAVLGSRERVGSFTREDLLSHVRRFYGTRDTIVACAGNFDEDRLLDMLNRLLGGLRRGAEPKNDGTPSFRARTGVYEKDLSEAHICLGVPGIRQADEDRYGLLLLNTVLGGGISSRLFQEIREKRGLAYSVYSFMSSYLDTGLWGMYAGTGKSRANEVISLALDELYGLPRTLSGKELARAKEQLKGNLVLSLESSNRRMQNIATQEIYYGRYYSPAEIMRQIDAVTLEQAKGLALRLIEGTGAALAVLGPIGRKGIKAALPGPSMA